MSNALLSEPEVSIRVDRVTDLGVRGGLATELSALTLV